ncbi:MAG: tyrosine-protein phosphatase [Desulfosalsimonas sp.]|uniref:tyrosine-protein phosphatase n=1 Tax=Desulfosalsimonas sp. TaxID=3073848 RepID=UPI003970652A
MEISFVSAGNLLENADISVYAGTHPEAIDRSESVVRSKDGCAQVSGLDPDLRYYFELDAGNHRMITAARRVHLDGAVNFRDIGGYETTDGQRVKWGRAFRADGLSRLTDPDLDLLGRMGIQRVYDFRTTTEMAGSPDRLFPYLTAPRQCIVGVIDYLTDTYGTAVDYLVGKAGLRPAVIDQMRKNMLE